MKSVVLFSGGMDSLVCALMERERGAEVWPLFVDYGQRHTIREFEAVRGLMWAYEWDERLRSIEIGLLGSTLIGDGPQTGAAVVVPVRNLVLCSLAANYAAAIGADRVVIGCNANDHTLFPDCRPEFYRMLNETLALGGTDVRVVAPLIQMSKRSIVAQGLALGADFSLTWSCYAGGSKPCGECGACNERDLCLSPALFGGEGAE